MKTKFFPRTRNVGSPPQASMSTRFASGKLYLRDPMAVFFALLFPLMMLFLSGSIFGNEPDPDLSGGRGSVDVSVPGYIAIIVATNAIMGLPINLASYRAGGVLRRFRATPLPPAVVRDPRSPSA